MINFLIADYHRVVIEGIRSLLRNYPEYNVVGEASRGHDAIRQARVLRPDIVIMDISMPDLKGLRTIVEIKRAVAGVQVIVFTSGSNIEKFIGLLKAGISAFVLKENPLSELFLAIDAVSKGGTFLSTSARTIFQKYMKALSEGKSFKGGFDMLSHREKQILQLLADGTSIKEIALALGTSPKTVESHKYRIMQKLDTRSQIDLTKIAVRRRLIQL